MGAFFARKIAGPYQQLARFIAIGALKFINRHENRVTAPLSFGNIEEF
jgi:hypothetical protein